MVTWGKWARFEARRNLFCPDFLTSVIVTVVGSAESVPASAEPRQSHNTTFFIFIHLLQELQFFV